MNIQQLQTERSQHIGVMQNLIDTAETEERSLTDVEQSQFDKAEKLINDIDDDITTAEEANLMQNNAATKATKNKTIGSASTSINTGKGSTYSLQKVLSAASGNSVLDGLEAEHDQQMKADQPFREFNGTAVPLSEILLNDKAKRDVVAKAVQMGIVQKASGVVSPTNLLPLTGEDYRDELFTLIDGAIAQQMLSGRVGARIITTSENTVKIPRQLTMATVGHVTVDSDLPDSADPTFSNQTLTPKLVGGVSQLNLSAMLAQHPAIGTNEYFASELRRGLSNELERVFIAGDTTGSPEEPNGLTNLATAATGNITAGANTISEIDAIAQELSDYLQTEETGARWVLPVEYLNELKLAASFSGSAESIHSALGMNGGVVNNDPLIRALNLTKTVNDYEAFMGDFSSVIHCLWDGIDVAVNPWADSVFKKGATLIRSYLMHDIGIIDPKRVLKFNATVSA